jgi:glutaredoxin-like protein
VPLLPDADREAVRAQLALLTHPVTLLFFTQTIGGPESALTARQIVDELASLHELITVEEVNSILDRERTAQFGIDGIPAIALLRDGEDTRLRFLGAPAGYEFVSLLQSVILAGTGDSGLSAASRSLIAEHVTGPLDIKVFVTPTCPHCPRAVTLAHRMAVESPLISATCIEATEFLELSRLYRVTGVPKTIVNNSIEIFGAVPEDVFVRTVVGAPDATPDAASDAAPDVAP